jgi:A/G-specific adenine glycosylase
MTPAPARSKSGVTKALARAQDRLIDWCAGQRRDVPWRVRGKTLPDPYRVWLSEIMCQQTTVSAVKPYYASFTSLWPDIHALAAASAEEVMTAWAGLGYYARARNLHRCAQAVSGPLKGRFPDTQEELLKLPGIGEYTAAAIAAIAFGEQTTVVDGNIERVMIRLHAMEEPKKRIRAEIRDRARVFYAPNRHKSGDLAQALMDLGALVCQPRNPDCDHCPLEDICEGRRLGIAAQLPVKEKRGERKRRYGYVYWIENEQGEILVQRRPPSGLLGGAIGLPTSAWETAIKDLRHEGIAGGCGLNDVFGGEGEPDLISHTFTHFDLFLKPVSYKGQPPEHDSAFSWMNPAQAAAAMPTVFSKSLKWLMAYHGRC